MGREIEAFRREGRARAPTSGNKPWTPEDDRRLLELGATGKPCVNRRSIGTKLGMVGAFGAAVVLIMMVYTWARNGVL
jgi:hypothetical protein